jgi:hypothetical protein
MQHTGVHWDKRDRKWVASITINHNKQVRCTPTQPSLQDTPHTHTACVSQAGVSTHTLPVRRATHTHTHTHTHTEGVSQGGACHHHSAWGVSSTRRTPQQRWCRRWRHPPGASPWSPPARHPVRHAHLCASLPVRVFTVYARRISQGGVCVTCRPEAQVRNRG